MPTTAMPDSSTPIRVLFVCMGNICRSPAAEIVFRKLVSDAGVADRFEIDSAGTIGYHQGKGPDPRMAETLRARGYEISGRSRPVDRADLDHYDHILVADRENLVDVRSLDQSGTRHPKIRLLTDFCRAHEVDHVPDPYQGGRAGFEHVADLVEDACAGLLDHLKP